jgi:hypothetical protein
MAVSSFKVMVLRYADTARAGQEQSRQNNNCVKEVSSAIISDEAMAHWISEKRGSAR